MIFSTFRTVGKLCLFTSLWLYSTGSTGQTGAGMPGHMPYPDEDMACGFAQVHAKKMLDPVFRAKQEAAEEILYRNALEINRLRDKGQRGGKTEDTEKALEILTIPIVVHIIHLSAEANPGDGPSNPTDEQILAGINHLNDAYRNVGMYAPSGHITDPAVQSVNVEIQFCLAQRDINGRPSTGILRYANDTFSNLNSDQEDPGMQEWVATQDGGVYPGTDYAHVWLVNEICQDSGSPNIPNPCGIAGYAYFPGGHGSVNNGVVNVAQYWGASVNSSKVHIHEFGHYLNLYHSFQGGCANGDCLQQGDRVCDTPPDNSTAYTACGDPANSCHTDADDTSANNPLRSDVDDLYENYMDYSVSNCQNTFTQGQKDRMRAALLGVRASLLNSQACVPTQGPEAGLEAINYPDQSLCTPQFVPQVTVKSNGSEAINSLLFGITLDGVPQNNVSWNGNIPSGQSQQISLASVVVSGQGQHELIVELLQSNGAPDPFSNNNLRIRYFQYAASITALPYCEDLEDGMIHPDWVVSNPDDGPGFAPASINGCSSQGNFAIGLQTWGTFPSTGTVEDLFTQSIDLSNTSNAQLTFDVAYAVYYSNFNTILDVAVSTDCGQSYSNLYHKTGNQLATATRPASGADDPAAFFIPESCSEWRTESIALDQYSGQQILLRFRASTADLTGSSFGYYWGNNLYLDNLCLNGETMPCSNGALNLNADPLSPGVYAARTISSSGGVSSGAQVQFTAEEEIRLTPGFHAEPGSIFQAVIGPCSENIREETPQLEATALPEQQAAMSIRQPLELSVSPNPLHERATIRYFVPEELPQPKLLLLAADGRKVQELTPGAAVGNWQTLELDGQQLPAGMYFLLLRAGDQLVSRKIMIQH